MLKQSAQLVARVGRRGTFLIFISVLDAVYAISLFNPAPEVARSTSVRWVESIAPLWAWGLLWAVIGVICLIHAFKRQDRIGFGAAVLLKVLWGMIYLLGWLFAGLNRGYLSTVIWLSLALLTAVVSTWPEAPIRFLRKRQQ